MSLPPGCPISQPPSWGLGDPPIIKYLFLKRNPLSQPWLPLQVRFSAAGAPGLSLPFRSCHWSLCSVETLASLCSMRSLSYPKLSSLSALRLPFPLWQHSTGFVTGLNRNMQETTEVDARNHTLLRVFGFILCKEITRMRI